MDKRIQKAYEQLCKARANLHKAVGEVFPEGTLVWVRHAQGEFKARIAGGCRMFDPEQIPVINVETDKRTWRSIFNIRKAPED